MVFGNCLKIELRLKETTLTNRGLCCYNIDWMANVEKENLEGMRKYD